MQVSYLKLKSPTSTKSQPSKNAYNQNCNEVHLCHNAAKSNFRRKESIYAHIWLKQPAKIYIFKTKDYFF